MDMEIMQSKFYIKNSKSFCVECQKLYSKPSNLNIHIKRKHPDKLVPANQLEMYICDECGVQVSSEIKFKNHLRSHQPTNSQFNNNYVCPICNFKETKVNLITHFSEEHDIAVIYEILEFSTMEEFNLWKIKLENEQFMKFVRKRGTHHGVKTSTIIFYCHRSGKFRNTGSGIRHIKSQGSCKINGFCPAELKLKISEEKCKVIFCRTHVGHTLDYEHINSINERKNIAQRFTDECYNSEYYLKKIKEVEEEEEEEEIASKKRKEEKEEEEEEEIAETITTQKIKRDFETEIAEYFKNFVENTVKDIETYEEFEVIKELLASVEPTLAAMKSNSQLVHKETRKIAPQRRFLKVRKEQKRRLINPTNY